jgi:predicted acylesterase/phospholipase RssA
LLWVQDRAGPHLGPRERLGPELTFAQFAGRVGGFLVLTVVGLGLLWLIVEELGDITGKPPPATTVLAETIDRIDPPREVTAGDFKTRPWLDAVFPESGAGAGRNLWLAASLPLGAAAVAGVVWLLGFLGVGTRLAGLRPVSGFGNVLRRARRGIRAHARRRSDPGRGAAATVAPPSWRGRLRVPRGPLGWSGVAAGFLSAVWLLALYLSRPDGGDVKALARSVLILLGLLTFVAAFRIDARAAWTDRALDRARSQRWLRVNLVTHTALAYTAVTYCLSQVHWLAGLGALFAVLPLLGGTLGLALPGAAADLLGAEPAAAPDPAPPHPEPSPVVPCTSPVAPRPAAAQAPDPRELFPFVLLAGLAFFLLCNIPAVASPVPIVCFFLFGLVAAYGLGAYAVRRATPAVLVALAFFAILAAVQPYKFRYDNLSEVTLLEGETGKDLLNYHEPADLAKLLDADRTNQEKFDEALRQYDLANEKLTPLQNQYTAQRVIVESARGIPVLQELVTLWSHYNMEDLAIARREFAQTKEQFEAADREVNRRMADLRGAWREMEKKNRVVAGRMVREDLRREDFETDDRGRRLEDDGRRLLNLQDFPPQSAGPDFRRPPLVVVSVSGGGLRSAAWTFTVLRTLQERFAEAKDADGNPRPIDFPAHVRIITGASGGMLGAAYYVAKLPRDRPLGEPAYLARRKAELVDQYERLTRDCLTPLVQQYVYSDLPDLFSPWPARNDRGKELERVWSENLDRALDVTFAELRASEKEGWRPSLVFTPMMIEDGRRLIISNMDMRNAISNDGNLLKELPRTGNDGLPRTSPHTSECYSREAIQLFRLFPVAPRGLRLSTAVRMSASFPFFSPAVSLPTTPRRRLVDAGYYDNYGVSLAASWIFSENTRRWRIGRPVLLIQIRDGIDDDRRTLRELGREDSSGLARSVEELSSLLEGLYNARVASSSFRNDGQLELLSQDSVRGEGSFTWDDGARRSTTASGQLYLTFQVVNFEFPKQAALSWHLSELAPTTRRSWFRRRPSAASRTGSPGTRSKRWRSRWCSSSSQHT